MVFQVLSPEEQTLAASNDYNFDHPGAFDFELLVATVRKLKQGKSVKIPVYDFTTHRRQKDWVSAQRGHVSLFYHKDTIKAQLRGFEDRHWSSLV